MLTFINSVIMLLSGQTLARSLLSIETHQFSQTTGDLLAHLSAIPVREDYETLGEPIIVPTTIANFKAQFLADDSPHFVNTMMMELGGTIVEDSGSWDILVDPIDQMTFKGIPTLSQRKTVSNQETGSYIAPYITNDITYLLYADEPSSLGWATKSLSRSSPGNSFIFHDNWEVVSLSESSEEVAVRFSFWIEWLYTPYGLTNVIKTSINENLHKNVKCASTWFADRV